ncbi:MAG TPA: hypothetical protein VK363_11960 [Pyrinomonadaceae bacterium]|nr:hypothetical protein [Pyrinomonadaceae bacterium]
MFNRKIVLALIAMIAVAVAGYLFVAARQGTAAQKKRSIRQGARTLPMTANKVEGVILESVRFPAEGDERIEFTVHNDTPRAVRSFTLRAGDFAFTKGSLDTEIVIRPGERLTDKMPTDNIADNVLLVLTAVIFEDGQTRGIPKDVEMTKGIMREQSERARKEKATEPTN